MNADELARILDELGERLGPTGQYVFELAVRQVYINAAVGGVLLLAVIGVGLFGVPRLYRWIQDAGYGSDREILGFIAGVAYTMVAVLVLINALIVLPSLLNPEYAALHDLLDAVR